MLMDLILLVNGDYHHTAFTGYRLKENASLHVSYIDRNLLYYLLILWYIKLFFLSIKCNFPSVFNSSVFKTIFYHVSTQITTLPF